MTHWQRRTWLRLRPLEDRTVPAMLVVTDPGDTGVNTLRGVIATANANAQADTITFDSSITAINLTTGQITISEASQGLFIDGAGKVTVASTASKAATSRIFTITSTGSPAIGFSGLTLSGGNLSAGNNGGAILFTNQPITLTNCVLSGNKSASAGGALATITGIASLTLTNCTVTTNTATTAGGAIYIGNSATVTMNNSTFTGNMASTSGGVFHAALPLKLDVTGSTFGGNTAMSTGGAINTAGNSTVTINNSTFSTNNGGALYTGSTVTLNVNDCTFTGNNSGIGGAVNVGSLASTVTLNRCTLSGNTAKDGGGFYLSSGGSLTINDSTFFGNTAIGGTGNGGGALNVRAGTATLTQCTISGNIAVSTGGGGGISVGNSGVLNLNNTTVAFNKATSSVGFGGGGIFKSNGTGAITMQSSLVAKNTSASGGPDIAFVSTATITGGNNLIGVADVGNFTLSGMNQTGTSGVPLDPRLATLENYGGTMLTHGFRFDSPTIENGNNIAGKSFDQRGAPFNRVVGGMADVGAVEGPLTTPFVDGSVGIADVNTAGGTAYGFTVTFNDETGIDTSKLGMGEVTVTGPSGFFNAVMTYKGFTLGAGNRIDAAYEFVPPGGAWDTLDGGTYTVKLAANKLFDTDTPTPQSAFPETIGSFKVGIAGSIVVDSTADGDDGDVSAGNLSLREALRISNSSFGGVDSVTFAAALNGSSISLTSGQIDVSDSVDITGPGSNKLTINGAAASSAVNRIFSIRALSTLAMVNISGLTLANCNVTTYGGAIDVYNESVTLTDVAFNNNKASDGGALTGNTIFLLVATNCSFTGNSGTNSGGAIFINTGTTYSLTINNCKFINNTTAGNGGAISGNGDGKNTHVTGSTFAGNTAVNGGGAIYGGCGTITSTTFTNNNGGVLGNGGALYLLGVNSAVLNNDTFTANVASAGGAIFGSSFHLTVTDSTFSGNIANVGGGGAIFGATLYSCSLTNCTMSGNTAATSGGALRGGKGVITVINCTIANNTANTDGGAVSFDGLFAFDVQKITVLNSTITSNTAKSGAGGGIRMSSPLVSYETFIKVVNSVVSGNTNAKAPDISRNSTSPYNDVNYSAIGSASGFTLSSTSGNNLPFGTALGLGALADNGGPTQTIPLLPGSPCINAGAATTITLDQRGKARVGNVDIGAFESQGFTLTVTSGTPQSTKIGTAFAAHLVAKVEANNVGEPVVGGTVTFAAPSSGASATPLTQTATIDGTSMATSGTITANMMVGSYNVTASTTGGTIANFALTNTNVEVPSLVVATVTDVVSNDGLTSLREAIEYANSKTGADTITFDPTVFATPQTILISSGLGALTITDSVTINAPPARVTLDGQGIAATIMQIGVSSFVTASFANLAFTNAAGRALLLINAAGVVDQSSFTNNAGGGIGVSDNCALTMTNSNISGNTGGRGPGIQAYVSTINLTDTTISNNKASDIGGGISVFGDGSLSVSRCTFSNNTATRGAGIYVQGDMNTITITDSTIANNVSSGNDGIGGGLSFLGAPSVPWTVTIRGSAIVNNTGSRGGGMHVQGSTVVLVENSTFSGNLTTNPDSPGGGGISFGAFDAPGASFTMRNSTVTQNKSVGLVGGGIRMTGTSNNPVVIQGSIISGNMHAPSNPSAKYSPDFFGPSIAGGATAPNVTISNSLIGIQNVYATPTSGSGNLFGSQASPLDAKLAPLASNGGLTQTHALLPGSPCINAGVNPAGLTTDQRGVGFARVNGGWIDIGAFESKLPPTVRKVTVNGGAAQRSNVTSVTVDFDAVVSFSGSAAAAFSLKRQSDNAMPLLSAAVTNGSVTSVTLTFLAGPAVDFGSLADGRYTLTIDQSQVSANGAQLDGNVDGTGGDNYVLMSSGTSGVFRLSGDADGSGSVTASDFNAFRLAYGSVGPSIFDFDNDGQVTASDFNQFRTRYGITLMP